MRAKWTAIAGSLFAVLSAAAVARADEGGVVACSRTEIRVTSCKAFTPDDDPWMKEKLADLEKKDAAGAKQLRERYRGVLVTGSPQGQTLGACDGSHPTLWATTEHGATPAWFSTGDCDGFRAGETVTVETPSPKCEKGVRAVPCFFIEKARDTTHPILPYTPKK